MKSLFLRIFLILKAIAADKGGLALLKTANIRDDAGIVNTNDKDAFITAAKTRQWDCVSCHSD
ncbi:hypothetical protein [Candidatus Villigracilis affinis]|uniref:hypothetical protein n=1 Tax=Candidatus Villigracilis affinis TaxID=3140682 RepID=UPI002A1CD335|nr:hypothetical protein [Anaerolineales bacterium]